MERRNPVPDREQDMAALEEFLAQRGISAEGALRLLQGPAQQGKLGGLSGAVGALQDNQRSAHRPPPPFLRAPSA